jgi:dTDP-4-dehydrorhamnose reductase
MKNPPDPLRVLVSGTSSGLGRALQRAFDAEPVVRSRLEDDLPRFRRDGFDLVVHCAADARKDFPVADLPACADSNLTLTGRLLEVPHRLFVHVSSQAVYPDDGGPWREDDDAQQTVAALSIYGVFKRLAEDAVRRRASRALILRCAALVGPEGRTNNIMRILRREPGRLFLSGACPYSLIAYSQIEALVREFLAAGVEGTFNVGAADERTLAEIAAHLRAPVTFGEHLYTAPRADQSKLRAATRLFDLPTLEVAALVARQIDEAQTRVAI